MTALYSHQCSKTSEIIQLNNTTVNIQSDFVLTGAELQKITALIYQRAGIVLTHQKHDMVYNRLTRRLRQLGMKTFTAYLNLLESDPFSDEWQQFINALTTNLTSFFREAYHFPVLAEHARSRQSNYSVWCTAAATGEEPCSIAMTLHEALGPYLNGPRIWATDIDTEVLAKAETGVYRHADIQNLTPEQKRTWFLRGTGAQREQVKVKPALLSNIHYQQLNLLSPEWRAPAPFDTRFDAIFCRNVMIYFDKPTQLRILQRFENMLKPGGLLFVGHSENFSNINGPFRLRGQSVYCLAQERT
ncbi:chemotaxis protein-glutamate O-methyltransferase [Pantoea alhagi]|uniref:CheR family methyltransferase n=1 Tax=Pantoea alhagi TaxID=1891675 RepID=UPI00202B6A26|nr:CheR family methyltransferase [Pantoea alhagi]URQ60871.1 chemotaxis protein-glutamate O-methyltransferase [Pantoea alhagi]